MEIIMALIYIVEDEKFYSVGGLFLDIEKHSVSVDNQPVELTFKEYELLRFCHKRDDGGIII